MPKQTALLLALATLSATATLVAQSPDPAGPASDIHSPSQTTSQPAPIERASYTASGYNTYTVSLAAGQFIAPSRGTATAQPIPGVLVRVAANSSVRAVSVVGPVELKVERGLVNVNVHRPANNSQILVDLPGGQTSLIKDGLYTFNASTNTVRVLKGEAIYLPPNQKQIRIKDGHSVTLTGSTIKSVDFDPYQARADLIPFPRSGREYAPGRYSDGFYGGYSDSPYYGYGDYPYAGDYGYGYPFAFGLGFGYFGGWGGGWHGGYGGFHGRR
jgi:hypothetical protein